LNKYSDAARANRFSVSIPNTIGRSVRDINQLRANPSNGKELKLEIDGPNTMEYWCEAAELPGRTLATLDRKTYGLTTKVPMQTQYSDITLTFICMANKVSGSGPQARVTPMTGLDIKRFFDSWMQMINPTPDSFVESSGNYNFEFRDNYAVSIQINHFDAFGSHTDPNNTTQNNGNLFERLFPVFNKNNAAIPGGSDPRAMKSYSVTLVDVFPISVGAIGMNWGDDGIMRLPVTFAYSRWFAHSPRQTGSNKNSPYLSTQNNEGWLIE